MANINLLPWREQLREERKRHFFISLGGSAAIAVLIIGLVHIAMSGRIGSQQTRNSFLQQEIKQLEHRIKEINKLKEIKSALLARMGIIQELQSSRTSVVHLFDELVKALPKGVHLTKVERKGNLVTLIGKAESNGNVSQLMRNISKSLWLKTPRLLEIKNDRDNTELVSDFVLLLTLVNPNIEHPSIEQGSR